MGKQTDTALEIVKVAEKAISDLRKSGDLVEASRVFNEIKVLEWKVPVEKFEMPFLLVAPTDDLSDVKAANAKMIEANLTSLNVLNATLLDSRNIILNRKPFLFPDELAVEKPPVRATQLIELFLRGENRDQAIGDLEEEYHGKIIPKYSPHFARNWYRWHCIQIVLAAGWSGLFEKTIVGRFLTATISRIGRP